MAAREAESEKTESEPAKAAGAPAGCSAKELDKRLSGIRWRLEYASFGTLRNLKSEEPRLVEAIRVATEWLVWGERHDVPFIDVFRKHTMFEAFACALRTEACPWPLKLQVLQSISILMPQLQHPASTNYLLSILNPIFEIPPDLEDEEMLAYFVTLLKSLVIRLDSQNVQYCLVARDGAGASGACCGNLMEGTSSDGKHPPQHLPVFNSAVNLVDHHDSMVHTAARTAILSVLRLGHPVVAAIAQHVTAYVLAPSLARIASRMREGHPESEKSWLAQWMWGDAITGHIAQYNPMRWSRKRSIAPTIATLREEIPGNGNRPVILRVLPVGGEQHCASVSDAVSVLSQMLRPPLDKQDFSDFVQDLFHLDLPVVTAALRSRGFVEDVQTVT